MYSYGPAVIDNKHNMSLVRGSKGGLVKKNKVFPFQHNDYRNFLIFIVHRHFNVIMVFMIYGLSVN